MIDSNFCKSLYTYPGYKNDLLCDVVLLSIFLNKEQGKCFWKLCVFLRTIYDRFFTFTTP